MDPGTSEPSASGNGRRGQRGHDPGLPASPRRLRENEDLMEDLNRRMKQRLEEIRVEDGEDPGAPFGFFCECSNLDCRERIEVRPRRYESIHADTERFILVPGHEIPAVETVVSEEDGYLVVRKLV